MTFSDTPPGATMYEPVGSLVVSRPVPDLVVHEELDWTPTDFELGARQMARVLASPSMGEPYPSPPLSGEPIWSAVRYWSGLIHLLMYSLGWAQPGRGLWWWDSEGNHRTDDLRLQILHDIFERDGQLDLMRAWLWDTSDNEFGGMWTFLEQATGWKATPLSLPVEKLDWAKAGRAKIHYFSEYGIPMAENPLTLDGHLANYAMEPVHARTGALAFHHDATNRRAFLYLDSMEGWYTALRDYSTQLPDLEGRSWYVDVIVRSAGFLGTYRHSTRTKLWFAGRHQFHEHGA